nr:hypothetical protein [Leifsonia sp. Leaf325]
MKKEDKAVNHAESDQYSGKKVLVTGGTGSFGHAVAQKLLTEGIGEVRIGRCRRVRT